MRDAIRIGPHNIFKEVYGQEPGEAEFLTASI